MLVDAAAAAQPFQHPLALVAVQVIVAGAAADQPFARQADQFGKAGVDEDDPAVVAARDRDADRALLQDRFQPLLVRSGLRQFMDGADDAHGLARSVAEGGLGQADHAQRAVSGADRRIVLHAPVPLHHGAVMADMFLGGGRRCQGEGRALQHLRRIDAGEAREGVVDRDVLAADVLDEQRHRGRRHQGVDHRHLAAPAAVLRSSRLPLQGVGIGNRQEAQRLRRGAVGTPSGEGRLPRGFRHHRPTERAVGKPDRAGAAGCLGAEGLAIRAIAVQKEIAQAKPRQPVRLAAEQAMQRGVGIADKPRSRGKANPDRKTVEG